jgi:hypothetical protein
MQKYQKARMLLILHLGEQKSLLQEWTAKDSHVIRGTLFLEMFPEQIADGWKYNIDWSVYEHVRRNVVTFLWFHHGTTSKRLHVKLYLNIF